MTTIMYIINVRDKHIKRAGRLKFEFIKLFPLFLRTATITKDY